MILELNCFFFLCEALSLSNFAEDSIHLKYVEHDVYDVWAKLLAHKNTSAT